MKNFITVMEQYLQFLPKDKFDVFTGQHHGNRYTKHFTAWNQLFVMLYAQATGKKSFRDISRPDYKSREADGITRDSPMLPGLPWVMPTTEGVMRYSRSSSMLCWNDAMNSFPERHSPSKTTSIPSMEVSSISAFLSSIGRSSGNKRGAIRLHTLFCNMTQIPAFLTVTDGKRHEITETRDTWKDWNLSKGSILVFDRGYIDYKWYYNLNEADIFFVMRAKGNMQYAIKEQKKTAGEGLLKDEIISFVLDDAEENYPEKLRLITYWDKEQEKQYCFLTNNFDLSAKTIADIYKQRREIETFFR